MHPRNTNRSSITASRLHNVYPGVVALEGLNKGNLISGNHVRRDAEGWPPMQPFSNGRASCRDAGTTSRSPPTAPASGSSSTAYRSR